MDHSHDECIRASLLLSQHLRTDINRSMKDFQQVHRGFLQTLNEAKSRLDHNDFEAIISKIFDYTELESAAKNVSENCQISDRPSLVVFGPNSSGKTSFIQGFLGIGNILPSGIGPVTTRIVHLSYATPAEASFYVYDNVNKDTVKHHENLASLFVDRTEPDWVILNQRLSPHLERPLDSNIDSSEFSDWAKSLIEIRLPLKILQLGIDVYDTPGFLSERREEVLMNNLHHLVKKIRPTLLFLYENATINETERSCFLAMKNALNGLERVPVFFLNTKADCISIANDFMLDNDPDNVSKDLFEDTLRKKRQHCYNLLRKREEMAHEVLGALPQSVEDCICFDICTMPPDYDPWEQFTELINSSSFRRIVRFAVETSSITTIRIADDLLVMVDNYFDVIAMTTPRPPTHWITLRDEALEWGKEFFSEFTALMPTLIEQLMNNIQHRFEELHVSIAQHAAAIQRENDPIDRLLQDNAKSIRRYLELAVREQIIKVAANQTIIQQHNDVRHKIADHFRRDKGMRKNELLAIAQRQVLGEISADILEKTAWINSVLDTIIKLNMGLKRYFCSVPSRWRTVVTKKLNQLGESEASRIDDNDVFALLDAMDAYATLSNENNRRLFAGSCLTKLAEEIGKKKPTFTSNLTKWVRQQEVEFFNLVNNTHMNIDKHFSRISSSISLHNRFSTPFAYIECQLLAIKEISKRHGAAPSFSTPIGQGGFYSVHAAHWGDEQNLAVKKLLIKSKEHDEMMALEIHYHRIATKFCSDYIVPLLYVYKNLLSDNQYEFWMIMPRYCQSLQEYLKANISSLSFEQCLNWALTIAHGLSELHRFDLTHRDLKSSNVMIDNNQRCYLIDFGTAKVGLYNRTILGSSPLPPEMLAEGPVVSYDGTAVDIYCFGLLLYELLPKTIYGRLDNEKLSRLEELLKSNPKYDENIEAYENLIKQCVQTKPSSRPHLDAIISRLKDIQNRTEMKLCTVCQERLRALRFIPCQHKVMCEACWLSWSERSHGIPTCIVCKAVVTGSTRDNDNATFIIQKTTFSFLKDMR